MYNLIFCDNCQAVFVNNFNQNSETDKAFSEGKDTIFKYLEERKFTIHSYFADIEQTTKSFIKWCPICKQVKYFSEVKLRSSSHD